MIARGPDHRSSGLYSLIPVIDEKIVSEIFADPYTHYPISSGHADATNLKAAFCAHPND